MCNVNQYQPTLLAYTERRVLKAAYALTVRSVKVSYYFTSWTSQPTETNTPTKEVVAEKVDTEHFYFLVTVTTPEGEVKDLTNVDDRTNNFWHESQWASVPRLCFDPDENLLSPIYQGAIVIQVKSRGLVYYFMNHRERMIFASFEADMAKLKAEEQAMIYRIKWKWTLRGRGKQIRKFLDLIS